MHDIFKIEANGDTSVAVSSTDSISKRVDYGFKAKSAVKAHTRAMWRFKILPDRGGIKQCQVVLCQYVDLGGVIPGSIMSRKAPEVLSGVASAIGLFRQDEEIDAANRSLLANFIEEKGAEQVRGEQQRVYW